MAAVRDVTASGDEYIDGLLMYKAWDTTTLTFSFPTDGAFYGAGPYGLNEPDTLTEFSATQKTVARHWLDQYAALLNLTFTEITETADVHADLRFANWGGPATAHSYYPGSATGRGGDMWFDTAGDDPICGNRDWQTIGHELGHALGLKHPHDVGGALVAMPVDHDALQYSIMSLKSRVSAGNGYTNEAFGYPATPMAIDIQALQYIYGPNTTIYPSGYTLHVNPSTGEVSINGSPWLTPGANRVFCCAPWANGAPISWDFSDYTEALDIDINADGWSILATAQLAALTGTPHVPPGNITIPRAFESGTSQLPSRIIGGGGDDVMFGNSIDNTVVLSGASGAYKGGLSAGVWTLTDVRAGAPDGINTVEDFEFVEFTDVTQAIAAVTLHGAEKTVEISP